MTPQQNKASAAPKSYQPYPRTLFHPNGTETTVHSPEGQEAREKLGYADKPFPKKPEAPPQNLDEEFCKRCDARSKAFSAAWDKQAAAHAETIARYNQLLEEHKALVAENEALKHNVAQLSQVVTQLSVAAQQAPTPAPAPEAQQPTAPRKKS